MRAVSSCVPPGKWKAKPRRSLCPRASLETAEKKRPSMLISPASGSTERSARSRRKHCAVARCPLLLLSPSHRGCSATRGMFCSLPGERCWRAANSLGPRRLSGFQSGVRRCDMRLTPLPARPDPIASRSNPRRPEQQALRTSRSVSSPAVCVPSCRGPRESLPGSSASACPGRFHNG